MTASLDPFRSYVIASVRITVRVLDPFHLVKLALLGVGRPSPSAAETLGHRGLIDDPLYRARPILRRQHDRLTERQWARLRAALAAGDPNQEITAGWPVAQRLMQA